MQTRNKNARNCSRSAKNLQTRNTHPFSVAERDHSPLLRGRLGSPSTHPLRFNGQGLISCPTPCPHFGHPGTSDGQGPHHEIRPCPLNGTPRGFGRRLRPASQTRTGLSTPGQGQGEGPVGSKLSRSDDADDDGRGRSERSERSPLRGNYRPQRKHRRTNYLDRTGRTDCP